MNRRDFLGSTLASLALSCGALALAPSRSPGRESLDYVFYDERFPAAEGLARRMSESDAAIPVQGDITQVWNEMLKPASQRSPLMLAGVTTESFFFCLKTLLYSRAGLELSTSRISQDLFAWSMRTYQSNNHGTS
jgi:hypothetical protein